MSRTSDSGRRRGGRKDEQPLLDSDAWGKSFPTTSWTMIDLAQHGDEPSIERFYRRYATPAYCFFRRSGADKETAKDLVQDVFMKLLTGQPLKGVETGHGKFRSYLCQVLRNKWIDHNRTGSQQLARRSQSLDQILDDEESHWEPQTGDAPERAYDRRYAHALLDAVIQRVAEGCVNDGLGDHFTAFAKRFLTNPPAKWTELGAGLGVSEDRARNMATTVRQRVGKALIEELRKETSTDADIEEEIQEFIALFSGPEAS